MSWADKAIEALGRGETVTVRPRGNSMRPRIISGQSVTLSPLTAGRPRVGDVVLVRVGGSIYLHLVRAIDGERYQIANNRGKINGWATRRAVYGVLIDD